MSEEGADVCGWGLCKRLCNSKRSLQSEIAHWGVSRRRYIRLIVEIQ